MSLEQSSHIFRPSSLEEERDVISIVGTIMSLIERDLGDEFYYAQDDPKVREFVRNNGISEERIQELEYVQRHFRNAYVRTALGVTEERAQIYYSRLHTFIRAARHKPHGLRFSNRR